MVRKCHSRAMFLAFSHFTGHNRTSFSKNRRRRARGYGIDRSRIGRLRASVGQGS
jgi:hypothetical protein